MFVSTVARVHGSGRYISITTYNGLLRNFDIVYTDTRGTDTAGSRFWYSYILAGG